MVLYFSCTGNSEYIAKVIAAKLDDTLTNIFSSVKSHTAEHYTSTAPYVFVLPVHNMKVPEAVEEYIRTCSFDGSNEFAICLVGSYSVGNAGSSIKKMLTLSGMNHIGTFAFYMQSSNVLGLARPNSNRTLKLADRAGAEAELFAQRFKDNRHSIPLTVSLIGLIGTALNPLIKKLKRDSAFKVNNHCNACEKCADACLNNNITIVNNKPEWHHNCTHCGACISACPQNAIEYGRKKGNFGYRFPTDYTEHIVTALAIEEKKDPLFAVETSLKNDSEPKEKKTTQE